MMLPTFTVTGTDRATGAIGSMEHFRVTVRAMNAASAQKTARDTRYDAGREHVLIATVEKA